MNFKKTVTTSFAISVLVFTYVFVSLFMIEEADADNNIVYKRLHITYYYCSSVLYETGVPIYSTCTVSEDGGMEDADHPPYTDEEVWGYRPVFEFVGDPPNVERKIVAWDYVLLWINRDVHHDHSYTVIWNQDVISKKTNRQHWKCR